MMRNRVLIKIIDEIKELSVNRVTLILIAKLSIYVIIILGVKFSGKVNFKIHNYVLINMTVFIRI